MLSLKFIFVYICVLALTIASRTPAEIRQWILSQAIDCNKEYPVTTEDVQMMMNMKVPDTTNSKCYISCVLKNINWLNENGDYDLDKAKQFAGNEYSTNATVMENAKKLFETCKSVNDEPVTDGKNGCERAYLLSKCLIENSPKAGFNI